MMNIPVSTNPHLLQSTVLQLHLNALHSDMTDMRCEVALQQKHWHLQQQQLQQDNRVLSLALLQAGTLNSNSQAQLKQLTHDSQCDALTQTLNRNIMLDRIGHAISLATRQHHQFALLFIDLDNFKPVNDQHGHAAGDAALQQVSQRLTAAIRDSDAVSRHGGDEFLLLLNNINHRSDAISFSSKLCTILAQPYLIDGGSISLSASIGIALFPEHGNSPQSLISYADAAMYQAKQAGGGRVC